MTLNSKIASAITKIIELFYFSPIDKFIPRHTFRYGVCGVANGICLDSIFYYLIYHYIVGMRFIDLGFWVVSPHIASMIIVFPITFSIGFWLNRYVAFNSTQERGDKQASKYALSVCGSIILSYIILKTLIEVLGVWATPAKTLSSILVAIYSYVVARYFTFVRR